jgi:hypothetical protein
MPLKILYIPRFTLQRTSSVAVMTALFYVLLFQVYEAHRCPIQTHLDRRNIPSQTILCTIHNSAKPKPNKQKF